jgi:hypothetical protein
MNTKPRLGPDDPLVQAAFKGIYKSSKKMHFRINPETGNHEKVGVCKALEGVPITYENKMQLVHSFPFPSLAYSSPSKSALALAKDNRKEKPVRVAAGTDGEEPEDLPAAKDDKVNKHFYIVEQGNYFGVYNAMEATADLYKTRAEAEEHLRDILHGRDGYRISYGGMGNPSRSHAAADVHY